MPISRLPTIGNSDDLCARFGLVRLEVARGWWGRARGLLGRRGLPAGHGLLLKTCSAIHTLGMRFAIDVVFLDVQGGVVRQYHQVPPHRLLIRGGPGAVAALELPAGTLAKLR
jgi:uncharacterized membrane protein (UPF0127 family)